MNKRLPTLLTTMIGSALYSQHSLADDLMSQCMLGVPSYNRNLINGPSNQQPITIHADKAKANYPDNAEYSGKVQVEQSNSFLTADTVHLKQQQTTHNNTPVRLVDAEGNVHYDDNQVILQGPKGWSNLNTKDTNVWDGDYQMVGRQGRGFANEIKLRGNNRFTILKNGNFTTCLPGDNSWSVEGSEIIEDHQQQLAEIWNARLKLGSVPIFYSPYLQLPIGDRRRSGFLIPNAKYSNKNGFEFLLPYYWNIAPQADATITPHLMTNRGMQLQNELRYLSSLGTGLIEFDYLGSDREFEKERSERLLSDSTSSKRWLFYWRHSGVYDQHWRLNTDYSKVSDRYYFNDLQSKYYSSTDGYAAQKFSFGYADTNWDATLSALDYQTFNRLNTDIYRALPQLDINAYQNDVGPFDTRLFAQAVRFSNTNRLNPDATRLHLEPTIDLPLSAGWISLNTEAKMLLTHYQQENIDSYNSKNPNRILDSSYNRAMPQLKVDGKMVFGRNMDSLNGFTQTLEPRAQYLYLPYRDQSHILPYDSTLLQTDYTGLFRDRSYSGLDRIASANQIATGVTSRIYDDNLVERFNFSVGQIYLFTASRTGEENVLDEGDKGSLLWAGDTYWRVSNSWGLRGGLQYDTRLDDIAQGNGSVEYRRDDNRLIQLNYRYSSPAYVSAALNRNVATSPIYKNGISQVGINAAWPLADAWSLVGSYYYDTRNNKPADQLLGVQYSSCCYAVRLGYERKINGWQTENLQSKYDNQISFNVEFRGLGNNYSLGTQQMLRQGIIPYNKTL